MKLPALYLKTGVHLNGAHMYPEMVKIVAVLRETAPATTDDAVWITSANDSKHMAGSLHFQNRAFDVRIWNIDGNVKEKAAEWLLQIREALGTDYDVLLEGDHLHVEFDPKQK
jgi:hypothetical protein